jgi:hypothetical protein
VTLTFSSIVALWLVVSSSWGAEEIEIVILEVALSEGEAHVAVKVRVTEAVAVGVPEIRNVVAEESDGVV